MLRWFAAALLVLAIPGAQACIPDSPDAAATASLELNFTHPAGCKRDALDDCPKVPDADTPLVLEGTFTWVSETDTACSAGAPSVDPVTVTFKGLLRMAEGWVELRSDPNEIVIPVTQQYDLTDDVVDPTGARLQGREEFPLTVTISLVGEPSPEALASLDNANGALPLYLKASMGATAAYTSTFALEGFMLDGRGALEPAADHGGLQVPAVPPAFLAIGLVALAAALRRHT